MTPIIPNLDEEVAWANMMNSVSPDYQLERIKRAKFRLDSEVNSLIRPSDPATLEREPLTHGQELLVNEVFAVAFSR